MIEMIEQKKCVLLGALEVGKTVLAQQLAGRPISGSPRRTVGVDFSKLRYQPPQGSAVEIDLWDTAGYQPALQQMSNMYLRNAKVIVFVYRDQRSFEIARELMLSYQKTTPAILFYNQVRADEADKMIVAGQELAKQRGAHFESANAKTMAPEIRSHLVGTLYTQIATQQSCEKLIPQKRNLLQQMQTELQGENFQYLQQLRVTLWNLLACLCLCPPDRLIPTTVSLLLNANIKMMKDEQVDTFYQQTKEKFKPLQGYQRLFNFRRDSVQQYYDKKHEEMTTMEQTAAAA